MIKIRNIFFCAVVLVSVCSLLACKQVKNVTKKATSIKQVDSTIALGDSSTSDKIEYIEAIYFRASGTEPFWGLEISSDSLKFTSVSEEFETFNAPHTEPKKAMGANVKLYRSVPEIGEIKIQIEQQSCTNNMSGIESKYQVTVTLKRSINEGFTTFKGCGNYITDYRLHDIWALDIVNGQPIEAQQYGKERPYVEINSSQNTFMGSTGNHNISGKIFWEKGLLQFTDIVMPQNLSEGEKGFIKSLQLATGYTLENRLLLLFDNKREMMKFRKAD